MLLTTCPNCSAQFKVHSEQLNVRQGRVMCGRCRKVFDAFQSLTRGPDSTGPRAALENKGHGSTDELFPPRSPGDGDAIALEEWKPEETPEQHEGTIESSAGSPSVPEVALPDPVGNPLLTASGARRQPGTTHGWLWIAGSVLLFLGAAAQATFAYRGEIAQWLPEARPWLGKACVTIGCEVPFGRDEAAVKIEASDLIEQPGKSARIQITATVANRSRYTQEFPMLELRLTDNANQVVVSRSLKPAEYLGREPGRDEGIPPAGEVFVNLFAELAGRQPASGYAVRAYYR
jgi:predicted Zn finger-like uncharacterized protein